MDSAGKHSDPLRYTCSPTLSCPGLNAATSQPQTRRFLLDPYNHTLFQASAGTLGPCRPRSLTSIGRS